MEHMAPGQRKREEGKVGDVAQALRPPCLYSRMVVHLLSPRDSAALTGAC
jgi:hypothetical protein